MDWATAIRHDNGRKVFLRCLTDVARGCIRSALSPARYPVERNHVAEPRDLGPGFQEFTNALAGRIGVDVCARLSAAQSSTLVQSCEDRTRGLLRLNR